MKNLFFFIFLIIFLSCKSEKSENLENQFKISGSIDNSLNGKMVYLKAQENGQLKSIDSTLVKNGTFEFSGTVDRPVIYGILIQETEGAIGVFMENALIEITAYKDSLSASKIVGSSTNDSYLDFIERSKRISSKMNVLFPAFQKARAENDVEKLEEINAKMRAINDESARYAFQYAKSNPDSYIGAYALYSILNVPSIERDSMFMVYDRFSDQVKSGDFALETYKFLTNAAALDSLQN